MPSVCMYFQLHQPKRLRQYTIFDMYKKHDYMDEKLNAEILNKVLAKCYLPTNRLLEQLINHYEGKFKIAFSLSGILLEQLLDYPEIIDSFKRLSDTQCVEFINETYYHSLSFIYSEKEFITQLQQHKNLIIELFNKSPLTFRNTELIYNNALAQCLDKLGYETILAEGADKILCGRSPNYVYKPLQTNQIKLLLKNYHLSDDIAFRFSNKNWQSYPLQADKFASWIHQVDNKCHTINLFMDYETFGEHQWQETGIFEFLKRLPYEVLKNEKFNFATPAEVSSNYAAVDIIDSQEFFSWADTERDLSAWLGNDLQQDAINRIYALEKLVYKTKSPPLIKIWKELQVSDHFYYMCTKWDADGDVHKYFNHYNSPYEAYINYQNVLNDFTLLVNDHLSNEFV